MHQHLRVLVLTLGCLSSVAAPLAAQEAVSSLPRLTGTFTVYVLDRSGAETEGSLVSLSDSVVVVRTPAAERTVALADVVQISRKGDSLKNGAIIGATIGAAAGLAMVAGPCTSGSACGAGTAIAAAVTGAGIWAAIGVGIDALIQGRTVIWTPSGPTRTAGLTIRLSREGRRAFVGWTFAPGSQ